MNLCVVGLGKVGLPLLETLCKWHKCVGYDVDPKKSSLSVSQVVAASEAAIFVVNTPSLPDGSFSNEYLVAALTAFADEVKRQAKTDYLYVVTSTTVPGSCERFRSIVGDRIVYNPLFIRLEHIYDDLMNPALFLVGARNVEVTNQWAGIWKLEQTVIVHEMSLTEAELAKITLNCALTMKISLANQLHLVAARMGCDSKCIMQSVGGDPRIGYQYLEPGWPYGGPCLSRDNRMFQYVAEQVGVDAVLSKAADAINDKIYAELARKK